MKHFINHWVRAAVSTAILASCAHALDVPAAPPPPTGGAQSQRIPPSAPGWIWSGMVEQDDPEMTDGSGRAGGPGSYGAYTFQGTGVIVYVMSGPSVSVNGRTHKLGNVKVSIDGHEVAVSVGHGNQVQYHDAVFETSQLTDTIHVLQIEPDGGWAVVDSIEVMSPPPSQSADATGSSTEDLQKLPPAEIPMGDYQVIPIVATNVCLDVWEKYTDGGTPMQVYAPNQSQHQPNQWFHITPIGSGNYRLSPLSVPQMAVGMLNSSYGGYPLSGLSEYSGDKSQIWHISMVDRNSCRISPSNSPSRALSVLGSVGPNGAAVVCVPWHGSPEQEWTLRN